MLRNGAVENVRVTGKQIFCYLYYIINNKTLFIYFCICKLKKKKFSQKESDCLTKQTDIEAAIKLFTKRSVCIYIYMYIAEFWLYRVAGYNWSQPLSVSEVVKRVTSQNIWSLTSAVWWSSWSRCRNNVLQHKQADVRPEEVFKVAGFLQFHETP